ncbi:hypothetical protein [Dysgonomonas sp. ZJ279]|nr:hypothetical protein [Dysgonomonas sp. ZJ279]
MYKIRRIKIIGVTRLSVNLVTDNIEKIRREYADIYNVKLCDVKFVYGEV